MRQPAVPYLEPVVAAAWWTTGSAALDGGLSTAVLAAGLGVTGGLLVAQHRRQGWGPRLPGSDRGRLLRTVGITLGLIAGGGAALGYFSLGELVVPLACVLVGIAAMTLAPVLGERVLVAAGGALLVLGAAGALLALDSAGRAYPVGVVGLTAGALLWLTSAYRTGLLRHLAERPVRRSSRSEGVPDEEPTRPQPRPQPQQPPYFGPPAGPARRGDTRRLPLPGEQDPARRGR
jgi:hypothetical protein